MTHAADDGSRTNLDNAAAQADSELAHALEAYFTALEGGHPVDAESLAADHPDVADRLRACIQILDAVDATRRHVDDAPAGTRLGDFVLLKLIGRGGMGIVFEADQVSLRRRVAVKILPSAAALDRLRLRRFQVEAQAAARLHHTNIVPVFSVGCEQGVHYYAMQFINGRTLADWLREARGRPRDPQAMTRDPIASDLPITDPATTESSAPSPGSIAPPETPTASAVPRGPSHLRRVAEWGVQAADALEHAHRHGVIHRDVKPSNMMVDAEGVLWITDFGLARLTGDPSLTLAGDLLGTLRYMSPEQSVGDSSHLDGRTDVYSLGATLYELLTLHPVHEGADRDALLAAIAKGEPRRLRSWNRTIPRDLETIVLNALGRERDSRYANAGEMAADLRRFLDGRPILARRPSLLTRAERWARRHKPLAASLVFSLALAVVGGSALLLLASHNHHLARSNRRATYVRDVYQAGEYVRRNDLAEATAVLSRHIPRHGDEDDRGFAWYYLWRLCNTRPKRLEGHKGDVYHVEYSPNGRTFATAGQDGTIRLWDAETHVLLRTFRGHDGDVDWVAFSPNGEQLASCGNDGVVRLWNAADASIAPRLLSEPGREIVAVVFTPDGRSVIWGGVAGVVVSYDLNAGVSRELSSTSGQRINAMAVSPDGRWLGVCFDGKPGFLKIDLADGAARPDPGAQFVNCVAFSADGRSIATGNKGGKLRIERGDKVVSLSPEFDQAIEAVAFSSDGRLLATSGGPGIIVLRDLETHLVLRTYRSWVGRHWSLAFEPGGNRLIACGDHDSVEIWDLDCVQDRQTWRAALGPTPDSIPSWSPQSMTAARSESGETRFFTWSFDESKFVSNHAVKATDVGGVVVSPDRTMAALKVPNDQPPIRLVKLDGSPPPPPLQFKPEPDRGGKFELHGMTFSPDSTRVAISYNLNGKEWAGVWTIADGLPIASSPRVSILGATPEFSPNGESLAMASPLALWIWDLKTSNLDKYSSPDLGWPAALAWTRDGRTIAVGYRPGSIVVCDRDAPHAAPVILNATPQIRSLDFSPDGRLLACALQNGSTMLMDVATGRPILTLPGSARHPSESTRVRFSPDGSSLLRLNYDPQTPVLVAWPSGSTAESAIRRLPK
ncbi:WD40 repeat domain-containing serine/threonine protein kinase [Paludisphaera rhizosphaerae]|uniref:WD40 repeat domain-containing serine/threonine protein kinase n=1 Tax=Paludisphaera rhizosphaerae TaxID=2711216 RepID=UPI0013EDDDD0|nr:protein kinase [Paludisphaera rhizosphaerae]